MTLQSSEDRSQAADESAGEWERLVDPQTAGWSSDGIAAVKAFAARQATDALLVLQGGRIVFSIGDLGHKFLCHSIRKSFLSAIVGEDVARGTIDLEATLADLGIDDKLGLGEVEKRATVYDLLTARSGIYHPAGYETEWMRLIKEKRHAHAPGTFWCYNNWDFNALGTIFAQRTGHNIHQAFEERIARPVGMQDFDLGSEHPDGWMEPFEISDHPAYPFRMSTRDLARFGQLFLQGGRCGDRQVLERDWVVESVLPYSHAGARGAYGYMWWLERDGVFLPQVVTPTGSFAAVGAGGHYCLVVPALDMVVVHRVDTDIEGRRVERVGVGRLLKLILSACKD
ncbi:serine hydrolase domain-containing protein [Consotaella aegiceratis]|uniref:serine hydrolase domain-containing protein n=1 Tax=Consotaella aegiceratis TaxID=3097961 RepID=UPI002F3EA208